ncbi:uncharacterized protein METZ01_LOCUS177098 [marine metagenome]|uniref:Uncharacterized protein n=1 Tax=marine metagenome TaxID=408172 RepID=A0A382CEG3_9ZZZZ
MVIVDGKMAAALKTQDLPAIYQTVRPYGGMLCIFHKDAKLEKEAKALPQARILEAGPDQLFVKKVGALPGSADWSHQYADAGQSVVSQDSRVKAPLGLLWFGVQRMKKSFRGTVMGHPHRLRVGGCSSREQTLFARWTSTPGGSCGNAN